MPIRNRRDGLVDRPDGEMENLCQQLVEGSPSAQFIAGPAADGRWRLLYANPAWFEIMAVAAESLAVNCLDELLPPAIGGELVARLGQCQDSGSADSYVAAWDERVLEITLAPSVAVGDQPARVLGYVRDLTAQRHSEGRLEQLEFALGKVSEAIYLLDAQAHIRYANGEASRMLGYAPDELLTLSVADIDPQWPAERWPEVWHGAREHGSLTFESVHRTKDGAIIPVEITTTYLAYRGNEYQMSLARDITARKRAEAELRARSEEFRALVEHSPDVVIRYDREYRATYANPAFFKLANTAPADIINVPPPLAHTILYAPDAYLAKIEAVLTTGQPQELVFKHQSVAGDAWAQARFVPEFDAEGKVATVLAIGHDVTALKSAERQLHTLVENLPSMLTRFDTDGRILYCNPRVTSTFGKTPEELVGEYPIGVSTDGIPLVEMIREVARTGEPNGGEVIWSTLRGDRQYILSHVPEVDENGTLVSVIGIANDITEVREAELKYRALADNLPDVVIRYDRECRRTYVNRAYEQVTGNPAAKAIGTTPETLWAPLTPAAEFMECLRRVMDTGVPNEVRLLLRDADGRPIHHAVSVAAERDGLGRVTGVLSISRDVTALVEAQQALLESEERYREVFNRTQESLYLLEVEPDGGYRFLEANPALERMAGRNAVELTGRRIDEAMPGPAAAQLNAMCRRCIESGDLVEEEAAMDLGQGERILHATVIPARSERGHVRRIVGLMRDMTEYRRAEEVQRRLNRELRAVSECNQVLLRAADEASLLNDICQIICEVAGYRMAWVGYAEHDSGKSIRPVAWAGADSGYVAQAQLSWSDAVTHGRGPAGIAVRSGTMYYVQDFATDRHMAPWREAALQRGYRSGIALPLKDDRGEVFGVLLIYSTETNAITPSEIRLLEELANDLAFGIVTLRVRAGRAQAEGELLRINRFLLTLSRCNEALVHASDEQILLQQMCRIVVEVGEFAMAWVGYAEADAVHKMAQFGAQADDFLGTAAILQGDELGEKCRPTVRAVQSGDIQVIQNVAQAECPAWRERSLAHGFHSAIALPLKVGGTVIGTFNIYASDSGSFGEQEVALLSELANDLGYGIETLRVRVDHQRFLERLQGSMESTIQALASAVELRDPYTAGHQRRVALLAAAVARAMNWPEERIQVVYLAGIVHDVGKIAVPAEILSKPGRLSETEMMLVRAHAAAGYDILKPVDFPWPIAEIVRQHHERLDGSGYPQGLRREEILPEARILAVCDVVEAMTTHRPYRPGLGIEIALQEIGRGRGSQFDPAVVDACIDVIKVQGFAFE